MSQHRYILEPYKGRASRYRCPECNKPAQFTRYIDTETGEHLSPTVGKCNREDKCSYHKTPKQFFESSGITAKPPQRKQSPVIKKIPPSFIEPELLKASLKGYEVNYFVTFLNNHFGTDIAGQLVSKYFIGSSKHWEGANVFWQIDITGKIRDGKIMLYSPTTGKRVKEPYNYINWVHKALNSPNFNLQQCFFGEHLLRGSSKPVAIVESEKTAVISSYFYPQFVWLAAGSKDGLNPDKWKVLKGRTVKLFPDLKAFDKWKVKAQELSKIAKVTVSEYLEQIATDQERKDGLDLADYLLKLDLKQYTPAEPEQAPPPTPSRPPEPPKAYTPPKTYVKPQPAIQPHWEQDISELETYFAGITLPTEPIRLTAGETITDLPKFIDSHLNTLKANNGNPTFIATLNRLHTLKVTLHKQ
ncbi:MAG: hypothetical protein IM564_01980 [Chitinophagaceae bacterium]|nr:hypothetical protein [Chitinophagaceae bacterium]